MTYGDVSSDGCLSVRARVRLKMSFVPLRNNGIRGQIEHEGAPPTLSQYVLHRVLCVTLCLSLCLCLCVYERMSVIVLYLWECPILLYELEYVSLISVLTWWNKRAFV